jgi:hypothetical protein
VLLQAPNGMLPMPPGFPNMPGMPPNMGAAFLAQMAFMQQQIAQGQGMQGMQVTSIYWKNSLIMSLYFLFSLFCMWFQMNRFSFRAGHGSTAGAGPGTGRPHAEKCVGQS